MENDVPEPESAQTATFLKTAGWPAFAFAMFVLGVVFGMAIQKERFIEWLSGQEADARDYVRLNITTQKNDPSRWSVSVDTWKPKEEAPAPAEDDDDLLSSHYWLRWPRRGCFGARTTFAADPDTMEIPRHPSASAPWTSC